MKLAIMQPYFLPYLGYWKLIHLADTFIILDDVNYINKGWINRNRIEKAGQVSWLTIPLEKASQNRLIRDINIFQDDGWKTKIIRSTAGAYSKAAHKDQIMPHFIKWVESASGNLSQYLFNVISEISTHLNITTQIMPTSSIFNTHDLKGEDRIIELCKITGARSYINLPGGQHLYNKCRFLQEGIDLEFLNMGALELNVKNYPLNHNLSILHMLMHAGYERLGDYIHS
jgi:hypothetical protein